MVNNQTRHHSRIEFSQMTPHIYLGTNLCCSSKSHIQVLLDLDVSAEINLEKEETDTLPDVPIYLWLPVPDKTAPSSVQLHGGVSLIDQMVQQGKKVYVHCRYGHGRSPTMVAAYLISKGKTVTDAIDTVKANRPEVHLEDVQMERLRRFEKEVRLL